MIYRFGDYALDTVKGEVIQPDGEGGAKTVAIEPQVYALLLLLIGNSERLVSKDEIVERIWNGRIVSDAAIDSRVRSARQAIGDDGRAQRLIRTLPKKGYRFVGAVLADGGAAPARTLAPLETPPPVVNPGIRPSIAVLPFTLNGARDHAGSLADAMAADLIAALSRLRWLFVIARGSSFRFRGEDVSLDSVREALNVRYVLTGGVETQTTALAVTVELIDLNDHGVIWGERFSGTYDAVHDIRENIVRAAVNALELQIPVNEARLARLKAPEHLDAWSSYHLGLHHLFQFTPDGNARANEAFTSAIKADPGFARAHAGLSFMHFEDAFLHFVPDRKGAIDSACEAAEKSLELDPLDPLCNLVMGRVHWLHGDLESSLPWLERAVALNPNYAQGKYSLGWTRTLLGQAREAMSDVDLATKLSPLDPLLYGMLGVRSFGHLTLGEDREAARWAAEAARAPGAHALIALIAAAMHELIGEKAEAQRWVRTARSRDPSIAGADFARAFPIRDRALQVRLGRALKRLDV